MLVGIGWFGAQPAAAQDFTATHYGESYNGRGMGCGGTYWSSEPNILAVGPSRYREWPCGTQIEITGPGGTLVVTRTDSCPGCGPNLLDLSEAGNSIVCGGRPHTCRVSIQVLDRD